MRDSPGGSPQLWATLGACLRWQRQGIFLSRVPASPSRVSLPGVPQNSLSGQRPPPPLSQISPPPPEGRGTGTSPYALVSLPFLCPFKSRSMVIKKGGAAALSAPAGAEGMLTPRRARDAGPRSPLPRGWPLLRGPASRPRRAGQTDEGRPGHGRRLRSTCPAKLLYREDENVPFVSGSSSSTFPASLCPSPALLPP